MSWFNNLRIGYKLMGAFGLVTLLLGVLGYVGWSNTRTFSKAFSGLYTDALVPAGELGCMEAELMELRMNGYRYQMPGAAERVAEFRASDAPLIAALKDNYEKYTSTDLVQAEKDMIKEWEEAYPAYLATRERMIGLAIAGRQGEADVVRKAENTPLGAKCSELLAKLVQVQLDTGAAENARISAQAKVSIAWILALLICAPLIALGTGLILTRTITGSLMHVVERATTAATGDLTVRVNVTSKDELGQMGEQLNVMMKTFDENMQQVAQSSQAVASASQQLGAGAGQISSGAQEQASSLEE
jgi:methyl-accepting chemotaxis protein